MSDTRKPLAAQLIIWIIYWLLIQGVVYWFVRSHLDDQTVRVTYILEAILSLIWVFLYFKSIRYTILVDQIKVQKGVFRFHEMIIPNNQILNAFISRSPLQKLFGLGTLHIQTSLLSSGWLGFGDIKLEGIKGLKELRESIVERATYEEIKKESIEERNSEVLRRILEELTEIKKNMNS